ncbi:MAG TPA: hypothetical protein VHZ26_02125 [Caulobacteraceae bacterium]|jgi:hypothetical protein|nr:hypothetical protein [Caulobacteraceae bacterium]
MLTGSYTLDAGVVVQHRGDWAFKIPPKLYLGLMTRAPEPEGAGGVELQAPGYERQPIEFAPSSPYVPNGVQRNSGQVAFTPNKKWPAVGHAALFDEDGVVLFYGYLVRHPSSVRDDRATFTASAIQLRVHQAAH